MSATSPESRPAVLVAGGAGYIGSHTAKVLAQSGMQPVVLDDLSRGHRFALRYGPFYEGSIADGGLIREIVRKHRPTGAILFAGYALVGESTADPRMYYHNNVINAVRFLDALVDADLKRIVFSSSSSVYGVQGKVPIPEDSPKDPLSPYAETKLFLENVLRWYDSAYGLKSACLRYFNAAGADPEGELGEDHDPETHLIPLTIRAAMGGPHLKVFGTDYPTPDGTAIRDYIHVTDLADGHIRALRYLEGGESVHLNLGTGSGHSVKQVIEAVERVAGCPVPAEYTGRREGDAPALVADAARAREVLDWTPRYSDLDTIVRTAWDWHKRRAEEKQAS